MAGMSFLEWVKDGEPANAAFSIRREFEWRDMDRFGDKFPQYAEAVLVAAARHYSGSRDFFFLPVDSLTKDQTGVTTFPSGEGEIALVILEHENERKVLAGVTMVVKG